MDFEVPVTGMFMVVSPVDVPRIKLIVVILPNSTVLAYCKFKID
jgi:hypothetical protein